ncbi:hypothetical protein CB1_001862005 [Camelus ferus]|nr:hypothetical protein CB1_001862005 [Camelus ferus]
MWLGEEVKRGGGSFLRRFTVVGMRVESEPRCRSGSSHAREWRGHTYHKGSVLGRGEADRWIFKNIKTVIKAFKLIDINKTGLVQPRELRRVLETFCLKMKDDEYKQFAKHYNIDKDTAVNYNVFLKNLSTNNDLNLKYYIRSQEVLWEDQQVRNSRKECLPSAVSSEDTWKNSSLDEIERTFCQEFLKSYEKVEKALSAGDPSKGGYVSLNYLKIVLDTFVYRLPRRIFIQLMKSINSRNQSRKENVITKLLRHEDHYVSLKKALLIINAVRTKHAESKSAVTKNMTKDEVIEKLKACVQQQDPAFRKRFLDFSKEPNGKVNVQDFKKVLEDNGMPMADDQYALLTAKLGYKKEGMSYLDFATGFKAQPQAGSLQACFSVCRRGTIMQSDLPDAEVDPRQNPYSAFFKIDTDRDGIVNMRDLRRLLLHLLLNLKDEEFERFLGLLGLRLSATLNFREFCNLCEKRPFQEEDDAPQRLIRQLERVGTEEQQKVADSELACEQAHQHLVTKAKTRWSDLSKNFIETDSEGNGILRRRDIKNALYGFDIPLTPREFEKLWMSWTQCTLKDSDLSHQITLADGPRENPSCPELHEATSPSAARPGLSGGLTPDPLNLGSVVFTYDTEGRGHITYQEFLQKLGISYSADVHRPYAEDYFNFMGHFTKPQQVQEEARELRQGAERAVAARNKLKEHYQDVSKALTKQDESRNGYIALCQMQKLLQKCGCSLKEEELTDLLNSREPYCPAFESQGFRAGQPAAPAGGSGPHALLS